MIEWEWFIGSKRPVRCLAGWIAGRPLYVIEPGDDYWVLLDIAISPRQIADADGPGAIDKLKAMAEKHRHELTGGLFQ